MKPLKEIMGGITSAEAETQQVLAEAEAQIEEARSNIAAGTESTGSKLHDGLVVLYGKILLRAPKIIENYEKVSEELKGKRREPIVLIHRWTELHGCTGFGGEGYEELESSIAVGVLGGTRLAFDYEKGLCTLPTARYAERNPRTEQSGVTKDRLVVADIAVVDTFSFSRTEYDLGADLGRDIQVKRGLYAGQVKKLTIAVGHEGIRNWLSQDEQITIPELHTVRKLCDDLAVPKIEPVTDYQQAMVAHFDRDYSVESSIY